MYRRSSILSSRSDSVPVTSMKATVAKSRTTWRRVPTSARKDVVGR